MPPDLGFGDIIYGKSVNAKPLSSWKEAERKFRLLLFVVFEVVEGAVLLLGCHSEGSPSPVIPRSASDKESLRVCHHIPPNPQMQIPRCARDDKREKRLGMTRGKKQTLAVLCVLRGLE
jgi:hypothetical protein